MAEKQQELDAPFIRDFTKRWLATWNAKDPDQVLALCSQDVVWNESGVVGRLKGHDAVRRKSLRPFFDAVPDVQIEYIDEPYLALDGSKAAARFRIGGNMTGPWNPPGFAPTNSAVALEGRVLGIRAWARFQLHASLRRIQSRAANWGHAKDGHHERTRRARNAGRGGTEDAAEIS